MATRGFLSFVTPADSAGSPAVEKTSYNHYDSFPDALGLAVLTWLHEAVEDLEGLRRSAQALRVVPPDARPTEEELAALPPSLKKGAGRDWLNLLWPIQGDPASLLEVGVIADARDFPLTSTVAEWGYVIDLVEKVFEVYVGGQPQPPRKGRFADREGVDGDHPVALLARWPLNALPSCEEFLEQTREQEE